MFNSVRCAEAEGEGHTCAAVGTVCLAGRVCSCFLVWSASLSLMLWAVRLDKLGMLAWCAPVKRWRRWYVWVCFAQSPPSLGRGFCTGGEKTTFALSTS